MNNALPTDEFGGIAIIGMTGRFPGARNVEEFWRNLRSGVESITFFHENELAELGVDARSLQDPRYVKAHGVLAEDPGLFDAAFFGYSPREAEIIDPQQRIFLECAWEAIESAGYDPGNYQGSIGVYAGADINTYLVNLRSSPNVMTLMDGFQLATANEKDHLTTRVSYKLNLRGPSVSVNTACSTSLVAVHLACQSLLNGECDMALAGGVSIKIPQKRGYQAGGIFSPDGHCRAFDARAQGTLGGSGVGVVVLKRLTDAVSDRDHIHAVIKGSAINNDGSLKVGYTAPSMDGQAEVIAEALAMARIDPQTVTYVEAHGTGTPLGDPIEIAALTKAFGAATRAKGFCAIGSVKTIIGHLDTAAGVAGLIKTILALEHRLLPPSLHFEKPNPEIDFSNSPFFVNTELSEWNGNGAPLRAGVSSFGIGGTNAHVVLEEAPTIELSSVSRPWQLLLVSAKTCAALETATTNLADYLKCNPELNMADAAYTLQIGRRAFNHRRMVICRDLPDALNALETLDSKRVFTSGEEPKDRTIAFLFPGQGSQFVNMAFGLYQTESVFRDYVDTCCAILKPHLGLDLRELLYPGDGYGQSDVGRLNQTGLTQPALFVVEYALSRLLMDRGIKPKAMIGHSIGEYVAACLAGVFSLEDGLALVSVRGRLMAQQPAGSMIAVPLSEQEIEPLVGEGLSIAAINRPGLCVVSGPTGAVEQFETRLGEKGLKGRRLNTSHAFHSPMMEPVMDLLTKQVKKIDLHPPQMPYLSNVTGNWITAQEATDPIYWANHLRQPVRFSQGLQELLKHPERILLEVGPGQTLSSLAKQHAAKSAAQLALSTMRRSSDQQSDVACLLTAVGRLWLSGVTVNWSEFYARERRQRVSLPTYPFERARFWVEREQVSHGGNARLATPSKKPDIADWFYFPSWKHAVVPQIPLGSNSAKQKKTWIVFLDDCGLGTQISTKLRQIGHEVITVCTGQDFRNFDQAHFTVNPQEPKDYITLLNALRNSNKIPFKILHFWNVTTDESKSPTIESFEKNQDIGFYSLVFLAQAFGESNFTAPLEIQVVSNNLHNVTGTEAIAPLKATLLGACKVIPLEFTNISCRAIDIVLPTLETKDGKRTLDFLMAEFTTASTDLLVAYRGTHRWVPFVEPIRLDETTESPSRLKTEGVYLITGGLGGVGLALAEYLAREVHAKLILLGRSTFPAKNEWGYWLAMHADDDEITAKILRLRYFESLGAEVVACNADVTNMNQMRDVIANVMNRFGRIDGVVHCAGIADYGGVILRRSKDTTEEILAAKVRGTLILSTLLKDIHPDFLILCSSLSSTLYHSTFGQVGYCAANEFLNAFASYNSIDGATFTVAINWCGWNEGGMAVEAKKRRDQVRGVSEKGLVLENALSNGEGADVFSRILQSNIPQVLVSTKDLNTSIDQDRSCLDLRSINVISLNSKYRRPDLKTDYLTPRNNTEKTLAEMWQTVLGVDRVGSHDNFFELGGDSLLGTRIISRVCEAFHVDLPLRVLLERPTIADMAGFITREQAETSGGSDAAGMLTRLEDAVGHLDEIEEITL